MIVGVPRKRGGRSAYSTFNVLNPGKGLNTLISDSLIDDRELSQAENCAIIESGAITKAPGFEQLGDTLSNNPRGLGFYIDTNNNRYLLTVDGANLKYLNSTVWTTISGATFDTSSQINFTQALGSMYIWDGVGGGAKLTGTTLTEPTTTPSAKFSIYYGGYHIAAGTGTNLNRIYISTSSDASDFTNASGELSNSTGVPGASAFAGTGANYVDVNKDDGDKITGFAKFNEVLIIFKEKAIFQLTFDSSGIPILQAVSKNYGCVGHRSIDNVDNDVFFMSRKGLYVLGNEANYFNVIRTNELSARIHPTIELINPTAYSAITSCFFDYTFYCGVPIGASTVNTNTLTYDKRYQAFNYWSHVKAECFTTYIDANNEEKLYFTSANSNQVFMVTPSSYSADGEAISTSFTTKAFDLGRFDEYKRWIDCTILFRQLQGTVNIEVLTDNGNIIKTSSVSALTAGGIGSYQWGASQWGGDVVESATTTTTASNNVPYRLRIGTKSRSVKIKISNNRNNENFVVLGYSFSFRPYSHFVYPSAYKIQ